MVAYLSCLDRGKSQHSAFEIDFHYQQLNFVWDYKKCDGIEVCKCVDHEISFCRMKCQRMLEWRVGTKAKAEVKNIGGSLLSNAPLYTAP